MSTNKPARRRQYAPDEIDAALAVLAASGSSFQASERTGIPARTLRDWKLDHADRYREIQEREAPKLEAIAAAQAREIMIRAGETEHDLLDALQDTIRLSQTPLPDRADYPDDDEYATAIDIWKALRTNTKDISDLAGAFQKTATAKGINGTKLLELTGRPTQIIEHRDPRDELRGLARELGIDWTAATIVQTPSTEPLPPANAVANARKPPKHAAEPNKP